MKFLDIIPLIIFFILNKYQGIIIATGGLVVSAIATFSISYAKKKTIEKSTLISLILLIVFGLLTLISQNPTFIKVKLTIISLLFSAVLFYGFFAKKLFIKKIIGKESDKFNANDEKWSKLDLSWGIYFFMLAILNEIIWRNFSENTWVNFKVFGSMGLMIVFFVITFIPFLRKK